METSPVTPGRMRPFSPIPSLALLGDAPGMTRRCLQLTPPHSAHPVVPDEDLLSHKVPQLQQAQTEEEWIRFYLTKHNIICPQQIRNTEFLVPVPSLPEFSFTELCQGCRALDLPLPALHTDKAIPKI